MKNVWLEIELEEYESHMSLSSIAQAQYLSNHFEKMINLYNPKSLALLGCAGGNGLEALKSKQIEKVLCVDINPSFLTEARKRYSKISNNIEYICCDISSNVLNFSLVEFVYAGLLFEYVDYNQALKNISKFIKEEGILVIVLQVPSTQIGEVSPSPYKNLEKLSKIFSFVSSSNIIELSSKYGFEVISQNRSELKSTKKFDEIILRKIMKSQK